MAHGISKWQPAGKVDQRHEDKQFYKAARWRRLRALFLAAYPLCSACEEQGIIEAACECHHKVDRKAAPQLAYEWSNLAGLCKPCHSRITASRR